MSFTSSFPCLLFLAFFSVSSFATHFVASPTDEAGFAGVATFYGVANRAVLTVAPGKILKCFIR